MGDEGPPLRPDEVEVRIRIPREALAAGAIALVVATAAGEAHVPHPQSLALTFRDGRIDTVLPTDHAEERPPFGAHVGRAVTIVATTSSASNAVPLRWDPAQPFQITLRSE